jgi:hypothetical protein
MNDKDADRMGNVWRIDPGEANKFHQARMVDHMMVAFECDTCVFRKLYRREPILTEEDFTNASIAGELFCERNGYYPVVNHENDKRALATIRRMILDAFWSRASSTVRANAKVNSERLRVVGEFGFGPTLSGTRSFAQLRSLWLRGLHTDAPGLAGTWSTFLGVQTI